MSTKLSRRDFLKMCAGSAAAISLAGYLAPFMKEAVAAGAPPVIWIQGASCTGCSISLLNTVHPDIKEVITKVISLTYHPNLNAAAGDLAVREGIYKVAESNPKNFFLIVEGAVPTGADGRYCMVGEEGEEPLVFKSSNRHRQQGQSDIELRYLFRLWWCPCYRRKSYRLQTGIPGSEERPPGQRARVSASSRLDGGDYSPCASLW